VQAFFADIYAEAQKAAPGRGHEALAAVACLGRLRRHYTLNIDGLAESVGLATWHPTDNPTGGPRSVRVETGFCVRFLHMHINVLNIIRPGF